MGILRTEWRVSAEIMIAVFSVIHFPFDQDQPLLSGHDPKRTDDLVFVGFGLKNAIKQRFIRIGVPDGHFHAGVLTAVVSEDHVLRPA